MNGLQFVILITVIAFALLYVSSVDRYLLDDGGYAVVKYIYYMLTAVVNWFLFNKHKKMINRNFFITFDDVITMY